MLQECFGESIFTCTPVIVVLVVYE